jgi:GT2 family glycosyltransferase
VTSRVTAVVLSWNGTEETLACLRSLSAATYPALSALVVDNASTDDVAAAVAGAFPDVRVIRLEENRGFSGGVNAGLEAALADGADHVLLLNNDATVEPGFLEPLVAAASEPGVGAVSSQILHSDPPHVVWYAGASYDPRRGHQGRHEHYGEPRLPASASPYPTDRACGGAMLVPRAAAEGVGELDDDLFAYAEDVDWSMRARAAGLSILVVPASVVFHTVSAASGGASSPTTLYYALRNGIVVAERYAPKGPIGTWARRAVATGAVAIQALMSRNRIAGLRAVASGLADAVRGRLGPRPRSRSA